MYKNGFCILLPYLHLLLFQISPQFGPSLQSDNFDGFLSPSSGQAKQPPVPGVCPLHALAPPVCPKYLDPALLVPQKLAQLSSGTASNTLKWSFIYASPELSAVALELVILLNNYSFMFLGYFNIF